MSEFDLRQHPHRRFNPLKGQWVLVSPHRTERPWQGQLEKTPPGAPQFDPECYLCPGNPRAGGAKNPDYTSTFVFENDFAALKPETPQGAVNEEDLLVAESMSGRCRVVCFSPRHDLTLSRMSVDEIRKVVDTWCEETLNLSKHPDCHSIQIFENRGEMMGCSNPHPHGQIWASEIIPDELEMEMEQQDAYWEGQESELLSDYLALELKQRQRIACENEHFVVVVPFWAMWPFETLVLGRRSVDSLLELIPPERTALADILRQITIRYDNLFQAPFPYTMGIHQAPVNGPELLGFQFHVHFYPPLLRSATIRKFMVGYEMLAMPQRDITPEAAAEKLRSLPANYYLDK